jgi:Endonuclease/Exonuclease/phosphatase family
MVKRMTNDIFPELSMKSAIAAIVALCICSVGWSETITVATYNIENFSTRFDEYHASTQPAMKEAGPEVKDLMSDLRHANDKDQWAVAQVILDPKFSPDILVIQEGCGQSDLSFFNHKWLNQQYPFAKSYNTNDERGLKLDVLVKSGFKVIEQRDNYRDEKDSQPNPRGDHQFARGPVFLLIESPSGYRFWVGTNHQKSKADNSVAVAAWRFREAVRTHQIIKELEKFGPGDVIFLGDMNDELGLQQYEDKAGGDAIAALVGPPEDGLILATKPLIDAGDISYGGYWKTDHRSFIDQIIVTQSVKNQIEEVKVDHTDLASVASDHYPVYIRIKADEASAVTP